MEKLLVFAGKRKTAVAKARVTPGSGKVFYNKLPASELMLFHKLALAEPLRLYESVLGDVKYDFAISTSGGGREAQVEAARLAIAKALYKMTESETLRKAFIAYDRNIIVPDPRRKETRKPGDSRARAKRQKSYR